MHNLQVMKDEFLKQGDYNVIVVDWSHGSLPPYTRATANTRVVGAELAFLIAGLQVQRTPVLKYWETNTPCAKGRCQVPVKPKFDCTS